MSEKNKSSKGTKDKIRTRYQGINQDEIKVIPAAPQRNIFEDGSEKRVAVYVRVSTDDAQQTSSFELQKNYYADMVSRHKGWRLVDVYADEGLSGTAVENRKDFLRMIADCEAGKIDLIVTKSISRFSRNLLHCIGYIRQLAALQPPVDILFETEGIHTLNKNGELILAVLSIVAQEESRNKSEAMTASIEMRFKKGIFLTPALLGYDKDEDGRLVINEEEAKIVRLVFFMYLFGCSSRHIAEQLTALQCVSKKGRIRWSPSSILGILQNERHYGAVLAQKTYTPNYLDHKSKFDDRL